MEVKLGLTEIAIMKATLNHFQGRIYSITFDGSRTCWVEVPSGIFIGVFDIVRDSEDGIVNWSKMEG
jgi:hypothetical protein